MCERKDVAPRRRLAGPLVSTYRPLDIEHELEVLDRVAKRVCASKESARKFLVDNGFLTEDLELAPRYHR